MRSEGYSSRSVCLSVCLRLFSDYRLRGGLCAMPTSSVLQGHEKKCGDFAETTGFERYGVKTSEKANCIMSTGLPRPRLACPAHRGRIKLLRGYVSKSSAALNPLSIMQQLACSLYAFHPTLFFLYFPIIIVNCPAFYYSL